MNGKAFSSGLGEITKITLYQLPLLYGIISLLVCISALTRKQQYLIQFQYHLLLYLNYYLCQ